MADTSPDQHAERAAVKRIAQFYEGTVRHYWVGLGEPTDPEDRTMPEVTGRYVTKRALLAAIENGTAFEVQQFDG